MDVTTQLARLREIEDKMKTETADIHQQIADLNALLLTKCPELRAESVALTNAILSAVKTNQQSAKGSGYKVTYRRGYERVSYDKNKLDGYAAAHPEILAFRKVSQVAPSASIKQT